MLYCCLMAAEEAITTPPKMEQPTYGGGHRGQFLCGRVRALSILDELLGQAENRSKLRQALQAMFNEDPVRFFTRLVIPLLPKDRGAEQGVAPGMTDLTPDQVAQIMDLATAPVPLPVERRHLHMHEDPAFRRRLKQYQRVRLTQKEVASDGK